MQMIQQNIHDFPRGTIVLGQANQRKYTIKKRILKNRTGTIYLCTYRQKMYLLKVGQATHLLTDEIETLMALSKVRNQFLGPCLIDVDDGQLKTGQRYSFYVITYTEGETVAQFFEKHERHWLPLFIVKLLKQLETLHQLGYVYGNFTMKDLVMTEDGQIYPLHLGHVTKIGDFVTVNAQFFDRSFWTFGSRRASPSYDLFVLVMIVLRVFNQKNSPIKDEPSKHLIEKINNLPLDRQYRQCFLKAVLGKYKTAEQMKDEFLQAIITVENHPLFLENIIGSRKSCSMREIKSLLLLSIAYLLCSYFLSYI